MCAKLDVIKSEKHVYHLIRAVVFSFEIWSVLFNAQGAPAEVCFFRNASVSLHRHPYKRHELAQPVSISLDFFHRERM
jgi:hypothetical protein